MPATKSADGTTATKQGGARTVFVGEPSPAGKNASISLYVRPELRDALVKQAAEKFGTVTVEGKPALKDGGVADAVRCAIADWSGYTYSNVDDLVISGRKPSRKTEDNTKMVRTLFTRLRATMDFQTSVEIAKATLGALEVTLTDEQYAALWDETAAA
jgi:hypothetical protein